MELSCVSQLLCVLGIVHLDFDLTDWRQGLLINCNIATFLTGSALIPLGLTWWQAIISTRPR